MRLTPNVVEVSGALSARFENSSHAWSDRRGWLITLEGRDGLWGQGECSPLQGFSLETAAQAEEALRSLDPLEVDLAAPLADLPELPASARCALECAVLDLAGRARGISVAALLGGEATRGLSALLTASPGPSVLEQARAAFTAGYGAVKWKAGRPGRWDEEIETLAALRAALGPEARIRIDINRGWIFEEARAKLEALEPLGLELVEEPCAPPFPETPVPLGADESLLEPDGLERAGASVRALVLKPMALGGARGCLRWARIATARGLGVTLSHLVDGPVALAFAAEIASALPGDVWACGLAPHVGLSAWPSVEVPQLQGGVSRPAGPGLGLPRLSDLSQGRS